MQPDKNALKRFAELYESLNGVHHFFAPGRVNLIGEHTDYNGGMVFPAALTIGISAFVRINNSDKIRIASMNFNQMSEVSLKEQKNFQKEGSWVDYPRGVIQHLLKRGFNFPGCDILYSSTLPEGAGLSSSAALEVVTAYSLLKLSGYNNISNIWIAKFCQIVENNFLNVKCGIMDQFSVAMGSAASAILLNCNTLEYSYVPVELQRHSLVIMNTNKKRELTGSKYNERREECDEALRLINKNVPLNNLCEATLEHAILYIEDKVIRKRAIHVITENKRVFDAVQALNGKDIETFSKLLTLSNNSLKNNFEVTGIELDTIVEEALAVPGCLGARMTGAGFGGCAIALVESDRVSLFKQNVALKYKEKVGLDPDFYVTKIGHGVKEYPIIKGSDVYINS